MNLLAAASESSLPLWMVGAYLVALLGLGIFSSTLFRGTSKDYFVASRSIGPFMLLMSCLLYTSPSPRDGLLSRMPSSA